MILDARDLDSLGRYVTAGQEDFERRGDQSALFSYVDRIVLPTLVDLIDGLIVERHRVDESDTLPVIHYTSIASMFSMIEEGGLHLFDSENSNDPSEGSYLAEYVNVPNELSWARSASPSHAYIASFVLPDPEEDRQDDLIYWRTYGREGEGCSLELLVPKAKLRRVLYGAEEAERTVASLLPILETLDPLAKLNTTVADRMSQALWNALSSLRYLYKDQAYRYENECRFIISARDLQPSEISFRYGESERYPGRVRHYCDDEALAVTKTLTSGASITFGPTVVDVNSLKRSTNILLQKHHLNGVQVNESEISYRKP